MPAVKATSRSGLKLSLLASTAATLPSAEVAQPEADGRAVTVTLDVLDKNKESVLPKPVVRNFVSNADEFTVEIEKTEPCYHHQQFIDGATQHTRPAFIDGATQHTRPAFIDGATLGGQTTDFIHGATYHEGQTYDGDRFISGAVHHGAERPFISGATHHENTSRKYEITGNIQAYVEVKPTYTIGGDDASKTPAWVRPTIGGDGTAKTPTWVRPTIGGDDAALPPTWLRPTIGGDDTAKTPTWVRPTIGGDDAALPPTWLRPTIGGDDTAKTPTWVRPTIGGDDAALPPTWLRPTIGGDDMAKTPTWVRPTIGGDDAALPPTWERPTIGGNDAALPPTWVTPDHIRGDFRLTQRSVPLQHRVSVPKAQFICHLVRNARLEKVRAPTATVEVPDVTEKTTIDETTTSTVTVEG